MLLVKLFDGLVRSGALTIIGPDGRQYRVGASEADPAAALRVHDGLTARRLFLNPRMAFGEAYVQGRISLEHGGLYDFLEVLARNLGTTDGQPLAWLRQLFVPVRRFMQQFNPLPLSRRRVSHHYDLSEQLYALFLDRDWQYSCAYFQAPGMTLDEAQEAKKRHIAAKLLLEPGQRVLDIGSGWGGLALTLARTAKVSVTGITLSKEQLAASRQRAAEAGLADRVNFELIDYRQVSGHFDRIVSVGMFEHVGVPHYQAFFDKLRDLLTDDGVAVLHSIGRMDGPGFTNPWLRKYIFPGGYTPALSEVTPSAEKALLWITDLEVLRLHYAETLRCWRRRFMENWHRAAALYDERFCRMWEFYLVGCELAFRYGGQMVFQMQLAKSVDTVPLTRDYLYAAEGDSARAGIAA